MIKIGCVIFCDGKLNIHYWIWENNTTAKTVVLAKKAVKSRRKKNLYNKFVHPTL